MAKTVMIVEDNELNMKLFNDLLESRGYSIIQTRNGLEARSRASSLPSGSRKTTTSLRFRSLPSPPSP
jgi:CheY-like chemotaxis protein